MTSTWKWQAIDVAQRLRVLAFVEHYLPGFKAGGPIRSLSALVKALGKEFDFFLFTRDRDLGDDRPYRHVATGGWNQGTLASVFYAAPGATRWGDLSRAVRDVAPDVVYANSAFSPMTRALLCGRRLGWLDRPLVIAPRGEWTPGALNERRWKKAVFLAAARRFGLYEGVVLQATSAEEASAIADVVGSGTTVSVVPNLTDLSAFLQEPRGAPKEAGAVEFIYWSRITPKKNLETAIRALLRVEGRIRLRVAGFVDDPSYWARCLDLARRRDEGRWLEYVGPVQHEKAPGVVAGAQFMVLPTQSENFGHAVVEALAAGCGVVISDRTPWSSVQSSSAGFVLPPQGVDEWQAVLQRCVNMEALEFDAMSRHARGFAAEIHFRPEPAVCARRLFLEVAGR